MDLNAVQEAHLAEVWEALMEAIDRRNEDNFQIFNAAWEEANAQAGTPYHIQFDHLPIPFRVSGWCAHCGESWVLEAARTGDIVPGMSIALHMTNQCPEADACECWAGVEAEGRAFGLAKCQECHNPEDSCSCDGRPALGHCAAIEEYERNHGFHEQ